MLIRTQIMLDDQLKQDLLWLSEMKNQSMSQLVRRYVEPRVKEETRVMRKQRTVSAVESMRAMVRSAKKFSMRGPKDLARHHDQYLY